MNKSKNFPDAFYRVSVRGVIMDGNKFLLGRHGKIGSWETFGGGVDFGEDPRQALQREILEETGCETLYISEQPILALPHIVHNKRKLDWFYNFPIYYELRIDISKFDFSLQYSEIKWFTIDELQTLNIFEGEEGIKNGFNILIR